MRARVTTALEVIGFCLVSAGVAAMYWPAGVVVAGLSMICIGVFAS